MVAFTHLCNKVNISLFDNTITLYPKTSETTLNKLNLDLSLWDTICIEMDCMMVGPYSFFQWMSKKFSSSVGIARFIHRNDSDHMLYHNDGLSEEDRHSHAQFSNTINEAKLRQIITVLIKYDILSADEEQGFMDAYHQANSLSTVEKLPVEMTLAERVSTYHGFFAPKAPSSVFQKITELISRDEQDDSDETHQRVDRCLML